VYLGVCSSLSLVFFSFPLHFYYLWSSSFSCFFHHNKPFFNQCSWVSSAQIQRCRKGAQKNSGQSSIVMQVNPYCSFRLGVICRASDSFNLVVQVVMAAMKIIVRTMMTGWRRRWQWRW
jgi:hypothetical protein